LKGGVLHARPNTEKRERERERETFLNEKPRRLETATFLSSSPQDSSERLVLPPRDFKTRD
jgi:hypothetical protein